MEVMEQLSKKNDNKDKKNKKKEKKNENYKEGEELEVCGSNVKEEE